MIVGEKSLNPTDMFYYVRNLQMQYHNALAAELF